MAGAQTGHEQLTQQDFGDALVERGFTRIRTNSERQWSGLTLREDLRPAEVVTP